MLARMLFAIVVVASASTCWAQTIQLPSFSNVGVNTTVVVPDSGGAYAARDRRAASDSSLFGGFPRQRGWSVRRQTSGVSVTAQIHDHQAADRALLSHAAGKQPGAPQAPLTIDAGRAATDGAIGSVAELAARRRQQQAAEEREALALLEKARQARAGGKTSVARIYYRMAAQAASGEWRERIAAEHERMIAATIEATPRTAP